MKIHLNALMRGLQALWHAMRGHPLVNAREAHQAAVRALFRAEAELTYHDQLIGWFDDAASNMDPHQDWHLFAQLKDQWQEHRAERRLESKRAEQVHARLVAAKDRLVRLERQP